MPKSYILTKKQSEYIYNADARWNLKVGAVRSGKSFVDVAHIIPERLISLRDELGLNLFLGVSKETIERNILQPMRELYTEDIVGTINSRNIAMVCGVPVYCLGAEKITQVAKIQGMSVKYCYGDEITKWNQEVFVMLQSRLDKPYSCFDGACNPEYPNHWLKEFIDNKDIDSYIQEYQIWDNTYLPKDFVDNLCKEYAGTVYYDRYILGKWALAEGLIYPMYQDAIVDKIPDADVTDCCISIDYGTMNAFAAILWEKIGDVWYGTREYYYSGRTTGIQKTDEDYANDLEIWIADVWSDYKARYNGIKKIETIIDPSAASFIALLRKTEWSKVRTADNAVLDGIRDTAVALKLGKIKILGAAMPNWKQEAGGYVWDDSDGEERPVKIDDHLMDSMRYFCKTKRISARHRQYPN
jgi:PBSX family phage terminase large subunit